MSKFSREHYLYAANWLKTNIKYEQSRADIVEQLSKMFQQDNPRFNEVEFYRSSDVINYLVEKDFT